MKGLLDLLRKDEDDRKRFAALEVSKTMVRVMMGLTAIRTFVDETKVAMVETGTSRLARKTATAKWLVNMEGSERYFGALKARPNAPELMGRFLAEQAHTSVEFISECAAIVLGHSLFDDLVTVLLNCTALCEPSAFSDKLRTRKVQLSDVIDQTKDEIVTRLIADDLHQKSRESIDERTKIILSILKPQPGLSSWKFDAEELNSLDRLRQQIVHRVDFSGAKDSALKWNEWLNSANIYFFSAFMGRFQLTMPDEIYSQMDQNSIFAARK
jgi:hypothetical protein